MLSLDLFNTKYERELQEGAVDNLEARRIDDLNMRMLDLLDRAREPAYRKNPGALAGLKAQFQKIKSERDSYFKINPATGMNPTGSIGTVKGALDELGIPGNVPVEKIPGKEELLKGRGRTYYEDQKKKSEPIDEYISMGSDKNYQEVEPYKNYRIYVRRKPFGTTGMYTAHTEIDRKEFMGKGRSQEEAVQAIRDRIDFVLNAQRKVTGSSTIDFNVKFATDLLADPRQTFYAKLENINGEPKLIIASADIASDPELLAAGDFKRSALRNQVDDSGRATPLPGIPLTAKGLRSGDWIANGRYTVGKETQDRDGNRVFDLTYHSTAHTKSDKLRLNQPAFTLGTAREVDEHGGGIGPRQHWQDLMQEGQPLELMNRYLAIDAENDVDAVRQAIQAISRDPNVSDASKIRLLGQLGMIIRRYRLPIGRAYYQFMQQYMEEQSVTETVVDVRAGMARIYRRLAPKIERHRDSFLAGQLYDELENYAELHGAEGEFKRMMSTARNRAHMEYDTNPGGFQNWFWFLPFEDEQLDEISRRDFLKGAGATAGLAAMGAPKGAQAQVGAGENESVYAANQAIKTWKYYAKDNDSVTKWIYDTIRQRCMQFYQLSGGRNFEQAIATALQNSASAVEPTFLMFYQQMARDKEDSSIFKAIIAGQLGLSDVSRQEQLKMTGSMNRVDLRQTAGKFVQVYTDSLNQLLANLTAPQQLSKQDMDKLAYGLLLYLFAKEDNNTNITNQISQSLSKIIQTYKNKDQINQIYSEMSERHNQEKVKDPAATQRIKKSLYDASRRIISDLGSIGSRGGAEEFKEESVNEAATDDVKKRMSKLEALALAANRAGDDAKCKRYQQKIQSLKQKLSQSMDEGFGDSPVAGAITRRIMSQHLDLLKQYGPELVGAAVDDVADYVGDVDEIGSSDVSGWVAQVERMLRENPPEAFAEGSQDFNKVEPYYVCLAGKPVKRFDYYQDARRFHDNWKQKLYREGNKTKADKVTLMPVMDEGIKKSAAATALAACMAAGGTLSGCATNPSVGGAIGTVRDVGTAAKTASTMTRAGVQDELGQELRNFIRAQGGDPGGQNLSLLYKLQKRLQGQKDSQPINEVKDTSGVEQAILKRIMVAHLDLLRQYGPEKIMTAASDVAYNVGDVDEIGTSDVSAYVQQVKQILGAVA